MGPEPRRSDTRCSSLKSARYGLRAADLDATAQRSFFQWPFVNSGWPGLAPIPVACTARGKQIVAHGAEREEDGCWIRR